MRPVFVFVKCELGKTYDVADVLVDEIEQTSEVHSVSGQYDLLVKFYLPEEEYIGRFLNDHVHKIAGINDTFTLISFRVFGA